jgi:hypothetical protein
MINRPGTCPFKIKEAGSISASRRCEGPSCAIWIEEAAACPLQLLGKLALYLLARSTTVVVGGKDSGE